MKKLAIVFSMVVLFSIWKNAPAQWIQTNGPTGSNVYDFAFYDSTIFAATRFGLFRSTVSDSLWVLCGFQGNFVSSIVTAPDGFGGTNLFACVQNSGVFLSADLGNTWSPVNSGLPNLGVYCLAVRPLGINGSELYLGMLGSGVYRSVNGANWISSGFTATVYDLAVDDTLIYAATGNGMRRSLDGGLTWSTGGLSGLMTVAVSIANDVSGGKIIFAGVDGGGIQRTINFGNNWNPYNTGLLNLYPTDFLVEDTLVYASLYGQGLVVSTSNGVGWTIVSTMNNIRALCHYKDAFIDLFFAGLDDGTGVLRSINQGSTWNSFTAGMLGVNTESVTAMESASGTDLIFAGTSGEGGKAFRTSDLGATWTSTTISWLDTWAVRTFPHNTSGMILMAGGTDTGTRMSADSGLTTSLAIFDAMSSLAYVPANGGGYIVYAGTGSGVFRTVNSGVTWNMLNTGLVSTNVRSVVISDTLIFAGTSSGVFKSSLNSTIWVPANTGITGNDIFALAISDTNLFAATFAGDIFYSSDFGSFWTPLGQGINCTWLKELVFYGNSLFAATSAGVFVTDDLGLTWTPVNSGLTSLIVNDLLISDSLLVAATSNGVWIRPLAEMITSIGSVTESKSHAVEIYPNPFSESATICFTIRETGTVEVDIYNALGALVNSYMKRYLQPGTYRYEWNRNKLTDGVYHCRVKLNNAIVSTRVLLVK